MSRRRTGVIILAIIVGGIIGSGLSFLMGNIFPAGPVREFFFKTIKVGFSDLAINLGFIGFQLGFFIQVSIMTIVAIFVTIYLLYRL